MTSEAAFFHSFQQDAMWFRFARQRTTKELEDHYIRRLVRLLQATGINDVRRCRANDPVDLMIGDQATGTSYAVEVKVSTNRAKRDHYYQFKLRGKRQTLNGDLLICLCVTAADDLIPYIIPTTAIGNQATIDITTDPDRYTGQWAPYRAAYDLLQESPAHWGRGHAAGAGAPVPNTRAAQPYLIAT